MFTFMWLYLEINICKFVHILLDHITYNVGPNTGTQVL